jgi:hypothetical protein
VPRAGASEIRRLSRNEYDNTIADLLNDTSRPGAAFPPATVMLGFDNAGGAAKPSALLVEQYEAAAQSLANAANLPRLLNCQGMMPGAATPAAEDACAASFIGSFGLRAYRRKLLPDEVARYQAFYAAGKAKHGFLPAIKMVLQAFLLAPPFLYRIEGAGEARGGVVAVAPYDLASRLSYLLWSSMPDAALFEAAAGNALATPAQLAAQVTRMLGDPRASKGTRNFFGQWLELHALERVVKDPVYAKWTPTIAPLLREESERFVEEVVLRGERTLDALLKAPYSYYNRELAAFYGAASVSGLALQRVTLDPTRRAGVLTQAAFLAAHAKPNQSSPVSRGTFVRGRLLCSPPPPPPANLNVQLPAPDPRSSTRERLAQHRADPACSGCHQLIDPIGLAFERYDGIGAWRTTDGGKPVDATGAIVGAGDADGPVDGAIQLAGKVAGSAQARGCFARQVLRFALGREETAEDACTLDALTAALTRSNGSLPELYAALVASDAFRYRSPGGDR